MSDVFQFQEVCLKSMPVLASEGLLGQAIYVSVRIDSE